MGGVIMKVSDFKFILIACLLTGAASFLVVCDDDSNDNGTSYIPSDATEIVIYVAGASAGSLGGNLYALSGSTLRNKVDSLCTAEKPAGVTSPNVRALISLSSSDQISNFPDRYGTPTDLPVKDATGSHTIADNWADLMDGTIDVSLYAAGLTAYSWTTSLTGSDENGNYLSAYSCNGWTSTDSGVGVAWGSAGWADDQWLSVQNEGYCSSSINTRIMCISY